MARRRPCSGLCWGRGQQGTQRPGREAPLSALGPCLGGLARAQWTPSTGSAVVPTVDTDAAPSSALRRSSQAVLTVGTWAGEEGAGGLQAATGQIQERTGQAGGGLGPEPCRPIPQLLGAPPLSPSEKLTRTGTGTRTYLQTIKS